MPAREITTVAINPVNRVLLLAILVSAGLTSLRCSFFPGGSAATQRAQIGLRIASSRRPVLLSCSRPTPSTVRIRRSCRKSGAHDFRLAVTPMGLVVKMGLVMTGFGADQRRPQEPQAP